MFDWLKLSHHHHSGHIRPREYTSFIPLVILMIGVGAMLTAYTGFAAERPGPKSGSIGITGTMPGEPPTEGAKITSPIDGTHFTATPVSIEGTCPKDTLVEVYKNDIFAGSTTCLENGTFKVSIDLLFDRNVITAKIYDAINQSGPESNSITIYYDVMPTQAGPITSLQPGIVDQLILTTDSAFRGIFPGQELSAPIGVIGGSPPYAINIQWGDLNNSVISRSDNLTFDATHKYEKPGVYQMSIQATDSMGRISFLSVAVIVNGEAGIAVGTEEDNSSKIAQLFILWPLYITMVGMIVAFWLGQKRQRHLFKKRGLIMST